MSGLYRCEESGYGVMATANFSSGGGNLELYSSGEAAKSHSIRCQSPDQSLGNGTGRALVHSRETWRPVVGVRQDGAGTCGADPGRGRGVARARVRARALGGWLGSRGGGNPGAGLSVRSLL